MINQSKWLSSLGDRVVGFMQMLQVTGLPGRFLPCVRGITAEGRQVALGFSCFALKIYYALGLWDKIPYKIRREWIAFLKSFQSKGNAVKEKMAHNAFIDMPLIAYLKEQVPWYRRVMNRVFYPTQLTHLRGTILAETKQAIATLAQVGESTEQPYGSFPKTRKGVVDYLTRLDWTHPWGAGAHASALAVFLQMQAPRYLKSEEVRQLMDEFSCFIESMADKETGTYYLGALPEHGALINGAMKVLTALDWLEVSIHYPDKLIDTCLLQMPKPEGCHLVDVVYVLYCCLQQTQHRKGEVQTYCLKVLEMIKKHHNSDGGFSYYIGRSQTYYYGVPFSQGFAESDIHGTSLLIWAITMILDILNNNHLRWQIIRP